ncbi:MAG TPA: hypothetical protein VGH87_00090 [Polyangiaceae bacterium]
MDVRGFVVRRKGRTLEVLSPQPLAERFAVFGAALYAVAIVVEALRSHAWFAAALFVFIAFVALWVAGGRVRYRLGAHELEVSTQFPNRGRAVRMPTNDIVDFAAAGGALIVHARGGGMIELQRGTMRSDDEARALAEFLRVELVLMREREAGYRTF